MATALEISSLLESLFVQSKGLLNVASGKQDHRHKELGLQMKRRVDAGGFSDEGQRAVGELPRLVSLLSNSKWKQLEAIYMSKSGGECLLVARELVEVECRVKPRFCLLDSVQLR